jgi:hypothetical protein
MPKSGATGRAGKVRVTVSVDGVARELFSVEERKGGDVMIFLKASAAVSTSERAEHQEVAEQRFSVHVSPKSLGHTIKQTLRTSAGQTTTSALVLPRPINGRSAGGVILRSQLRFCWPIFMVRPPRLDAERYESKPKAADRQVSIGSFNPNLASLVYMVIATSPDVLDITMTRERTNLATLRFTRFNLHIMHGCSLAPAIGPGDFLTFATGPQRADGDQPITAKEPAISFSLPAVEGRFFEGFGIIRDRHASRFLMKADHDAPDESIATSMWGLSAVCVRAPPLTGAETMQHFEQYLAEVSAHMARSPTVGRSRGSLPDWLEKRVREAEASRH